MAVPISLDSEAEGMAIKAEDLPCFSGIKLLHIKRAVCEMLAQIGRERIFSTYTMHDIGHIDKLLDILGWLIPANTKKIMSPTDWLLAVLSIYFHDMGMVVTRAEFDARAKSGFPEFCASLNRGEAAQDYMAKVEELPPDERDRFLYQEFVRHNHATRIRHWVSGRADPLLGISDVIAAEIDQLLSPLGHDARSDLGLICESHHLDDLDDITKYSLDRAYGNSESESANLQYIAVLLRSADLLQITNDRTPSITFRLVNPTDPVSLEEWAKQRAVKRVNSKPGVNQEGIPDEAAPRDSIAIHARFTSEEGFFGLTSYLDYSARQLRQSRDWIESSKRKTVLSRQYDFPWRHIDDSNVLTEGFIPKIFQFSLDERRILDLLTGHTLYNNADVVLRELAQNAIDAVRLQFFNRGNLARDGRVEISWNSSRRVLSIKDNGTGMTQEIIEKHLLTVGSSRYRDQKFVEQNPDFSPISRFGIGVLTSFMVADQVQVTTSHPDEPDAREISLRTVHGRYLIKLLKKRVAPEAIDVGDHGTIVRLWVRRSASVGDVLATARKWLIIPGCGVTVKIDDNPPLAVGYPSPKDALLAMLAERGFSIDGDEATTAQQRLRVVEDAREGIRLGYVVEWMKYFREWQFYKPTKTRVFDTSTDRDMWQNVGLCVEGIRVKFDTPGYQGKVILALANCTGSSAPRTNVARSELDKTPGLSLINGLIYDLYSDHIRKEVVRLQRDGGFSLTWSVGECRFLASPLRESDDFESRQERVEEPELFEKALLDLPLVVIERDGQREACSLTELRGMSPFWTVHSALFQNAEYLLREVSTPMSLADLSRITGANGFVLPSGPVVTGATFGDDLFEGGLRNFEVAGIQIDTASRRVDLRWQKMTSRPLWLGLTQVEMARMHQKVPRVMFMEERRFSTLRSNSRYVLQVGHVDVTGTSDFTAVRVGSATYVLARDGLEVLLAPFLQNKTGSHGLALYVLLRVIDSLYDRTRFSFENLKEETNEILIRGGASDSVRDFNNLLDYFHSNSLTIFDPTDWQRGNE